MSKKDEALKLIFSQRFNPDEIEEITESFSKIVPTEKRLFAIDSIGTVAVVLTIGLGSFVLGSIAKNFFEAMGSDFYKIAKEKVIRIFKNKQNPTLIFEMSLEDTKILITSRTNDERELNEIFDTRDKARDIAMKELDKRKTPEIRIYYDNGWISDSEKTP